MLRLLLFPVDYDYHTLCQLHFLLHSRTRFFYTIRNMLDAEIRQNIRPYITSTEYTLTTSLLSTKLFYTIRFFQYDKVIKPGCICTALCIVDNFIHSHFILCCACSQQTAYIWLASTSYECITLHSIHTTLHSPCKQCDCGKISHFLLRRGTFFQCEQNFPCTFPYGIVCTSFHLLAGLMFITNLELRVCANSNNHLHVCSDQIISARRWTIPFILLFVFRQCFITLKALYHRTVCNF